MVQVYVVNYETTSLIFSLKNLNQTRTLRTQSFADGRAKNGGDSCRFSLFFFSPSLLAFVLPNQLIWGSGVCCKFLHCGVTQTILMDFELTEMPFATLERPLIVLSTNWKQKSSFVIFVILLTLRVLWQTVWLVQTAVTKFQLNS